MAQVLVLDELYTDEGAASPTVTASLASTMSSTESSKRVRAPRDFYIEFFENWESSKIQKSGRTVMRHVGVCSFRVKTVTINGVNTYNNLTACCVQPKSSEVSMIPSFDAECA